MKKLILLFVIFFVFIVYSLTISSEKTVPSVSPSPTPYIFSEDKLWSLIQDWRQSQGLSPYIKDQRLCAIAKDRVFNGPVLDSHAGLYCKYSSYPYVVQENLADYPNEKTMLVRWITSPFGHKETLEKPYIYSCVQCKNTYCSQIFSNF